MPDIKITLNDGSTKTVRFADGFTDADIEEVANNLNAGLKPQQTEYERIANDSSLTREQKAQAINDYFKKEQRDIQKERWGTHAKNFGGAGLEIGSALIPIGGGAKLATKLLPKAAPVVKNLASNVISGGVAGGVSGFGRGMREGENPLQTATQDAALGAGITSAMPFVGQGVKNVIENPKFQNAVGTTLEAFTSVPKKYVETALNKELAGQSIFKGKFDADTAYRPIEQKLREAKGMLPTDVDFGEEYYKLGQKALTGMENLKEEAGQKINEVLDNLNFREVQNNGIKNAVDSLINSYGKGGVYNSAKKRAPQVVNFLDGELSKDGLTLIDLHRIKEDLYDMGYSLAGNKQGKAAEVARGAAGQINNYLRGAVPDYAKPNDIYSMIVDVTRGLDGETTIADKLSNIGSVNSAKSGLDNRLKSIDNLLPQENKFYKQSQDLIGSEKEINEIKNLVGKQYERNPRLLGNRTDEAFENALNDLQNKTGVNFMDELETTRAREALEKLAPGQGGGSGGEQGFFNNVVRPTIQAFPKTATAAILGSTFGGPIGSTLGLLSVSPKFAGQGTIKNLGSLYRLTDKIPPEWITSRIMPTINLGRE
jgi:hypothetical protein